MLADSAKIQEEDAAHLNIARNYAEPWVQPLEHPIVVLAVREGTNAQHAAKSVLLKVGK